MEKRIRSPNYPSLSLPDAINKVAALYRAQHTHSAPREIVAKGMGYNSLNGASASAISALHKYGLLDRVGDEIKISERAMRILHPHSPAERSKAIQEAAYAPPLFAELNERFPEMFPNEDLLRNYLIRNGFAPSAVTSVILAYRETSAIAESEYLEHDSPHEQTQEHAAMRHPSTVSFADHSVASTSPQSQALPKAGPIPVIAIMEDHIVVNTVVRTREKARALRRMIEMVEEHLPETESTTSITEPSTNSQANFGQSEESSSEV